MSIFPLQTLEAHRLVKFFRSRKVVDGVSLNVKQGEVIGLLGPNGSGKTTIFKMMVGIIPLDDGYILLNSQNITDKPIYKRSRMGIGYLPQESSTFRKLSVEENLMAISEAIPMDRSQRKEKVDELLQEFDLINIKCQRAETLSGGERRRLEIARALVTEPVFMLLDEPFAGIDPKTVIGIQDIIAQLKERGIGVIITDHNVRETLAITDRSYMIYEGKVLMEGTARELAMDERTKEVYLGDRFQL